MFHVLPLLLAISAMQILFVFRSRGLVCVQPWAVYTLLVQLNSFVTRAHCIVGACLFTLRAHAQYGFRAVPCRAARLPCQGRHDTVRHGTARVHMSTLACRAVPNRVRTVLDRPCERSTSCLFYVTNCNSSLNSLANTGAEVSVVPPSHAEQNVSNAVKNYKQSMVASSLQ